MRIGLHAALLAALILICVAVTPAQSPASAAQEGVDGLRAQLRDVEAKEVELQAREKQLGEDLRPENIERSLALTGSTRPEELREQRRQQLEAEKGRVRAQLEQLATRRSRLETAITTAETTEAYRQSVVAGATNNAATTNTSSVSIPPARRNSSITAAGTAGVARRTRARRKPLARHRRRSLPRRLRRAR